MASKLCLVESSAMDWSQKCNVLAQETYTRLANTREELRLRHKLEILETWILKIKRLGCCVKKVMEILESSLKWYVRKVCEARQEG